ncbi:MAG: response regulator transcription factor [Armatimonadia bacterium]
MGIRIVVADDHQIIRQGLRMLFDSEADMELVGEAENGEQAVQLAAELSPDIVVMDIGMPVMDGFAATRQLQAEQPDIKVVALSMHDDRAFLEGMKAAGAEGYVLKDAAFEDLTAAIRKILDGGTFFPNGESQN